MNMMRLIRTLAPVLLLPALFFAPLSGQTPADLQKQVKRQSGQIKQLARVVVAQKKAALALSDSLRVKSRRTDSLVSGISAGQLKLEKQLIENRTHAAEVADSLALANMKKMRSIERNVRSYFFLSVILTVLLLALFIVVVSRLFRRLFFFDPEVSRSLGMISRLFSSMRKKEEEASPLLPAGAAPARAAASPSRPSDADHSFYLRVAEEIHRMRVRIERMPQDTKGVVALANAIQRLEEELRLKGYEVFDLTGMEYNDGMTALVRDFIPMDDMPRGARRIVRTLKPQVKFNNSVISHGEIEVAISAADLAQK